MIWIIFALIAAFLWATVNHMDKYLLSKYCKNREIGGLAIFSSLIGIPVAIIIFLFNPSVLNIPFHQALIMIIAGALYLAGVICYLYALDTDETSIVAPQTLMLIIFTGALGHIFLNERLSTIQFFGILIIISGALTLSLNITDITKLRLKSKVFLFMFASSFFVGLQTFLFKYFAIETTFWTTAFWLHIGFAFVTAILFFIVKNYRNQFFKLVKTNTSKIVTVNLLGEIFTILGNISFYYGALFIPLAIAEGITEGIQPFFVLLIGIIITFLFPKLGKESIQAKNLLHKLTSILIMLSGVYLVLH